MRFQHDRRGRAEYDEDRGGFSRVIAVDFDGVLCENAWPEIGEANTRVIAELRNRQQLGDRIILWTCREGELLDEALAWCKKRGLRFDAINDNLPETVKEFGGNTRKIFADEYWDDKSIRIVDGEIYD